MSGLITVKMLVEHYYSSMARDSIEATFEGYTEDDEGRWHKVEFKSNDMDEISRFHAELSNGAKRIELFHDRVRWLD